MHAMHRSLEEMQLGIGLVKPISSDIWGSHPLRTMRAEGTAQVCEMRIDIAARKLTWLKRVFGLVGR